MRNIRKTTAVLILQLILLLGLTARAQNETNIDTTAFNEVLNFLGQGSNWIVAPYGIYANSKDLKNHAGGGLAVAYKLSDFVVPALRIDYVGSEFWMPSGSLQLQLPIHPTSSTNFAIIPFTFGGIATPLSGGGSANHDAVGILGVGAAVRITAHLDILADVERWTAYSGQQYRFGFAWKF